MFKWPFGKKARAERAAEESRQLAEEEALDAEIEELLQESEALERGELPARGPGSSREYKSEGLPEGAAELLVAMGRAGRTLVTLRTRERVLQLLRAHPESEALANPIAQLGTGILRCRVALGLLPPDTAIPLLQLDASVNNPSSAADTRGIILMEIELVFMQAELNFDLANTAADSEPLSRVEKIVEGYQQFFEGCSGLDRNASRILRLAAMQDLAGASEAAVANSWTDETSFAADPLGQLWPEGMSVAGVEAEQVPETASVGIEALLAERLGMHRDRMLAVDHPDQDFIREALAEDDIALFAGFAAEKMRLTLADGEVHSTLIAGSPVAVVIYTIKGTVGEAAAWYEENHGGYTMMMDTFMQGPEVVASGAEVLCHLTFGHTGDDAWVNLTFMPLSGDRFRKVPIIAMDLLSEAEKAQHGFA